MNRFPSDPMLRGAVIWLGGLAGCAMMMGSNVVGQTGAEAANVQFPEITNVHQIRLSAGQIPKTAYTLHLEGDVWWAHAADGKFVLKDGSGAEELEMDSKGQVLK